jgi:hypothetical protein
MQDLTDVIREANHQATLKGTSVGVNWELEKGRWGIYDLTKGCPEGSQPELICFGQGVMPLAVTLSAYEPLLCAINSVVGDWDKSTELTGEQICRLKEKI